MSLNPECKDFHVQLDVCGMHLCIELTLIKILDVEDEASRPGFLDKTVTWLNIGPFSHDILLLQNNLFIGFLRYVNSYGSNTPMICFHEL